MLANISANLPAAARVAFDGEKHIDYIVPERVYSTRDISLPEQAGVSLMAVSEPFQLFMPGAIHQMRLEMLSKDILDNCYYSSHLAREGHLRGYAAQYAPFIYEA